jgi:eukaryotic-like serine/threonine-protein kinase
MSAWTIPSYAEWAVPGYTEERLLGHGVSGRVVAAVNDATGRRVAIKYFDAGLVRDTGFAREFRAEAERLESLDAAHAVRIFDYFEQPGEGAALVTQLVDGVSLREMLAHRGPLGAEAALVVLKDSLLGLAAAHSRRVPHRDLKPDNVLIDANGWCTVTDFGVAVKADRQMPAAGTPAYMAPELWNGAPNVPATDIYAAAALLCESVTGAPPFSGRLGQLRHQHESVPVAIDPVDQPVQGLIAWGMAKNPADRPRSARGFLTEVDAQAAAAYGPTWEDQGRRELGERAAALLPLLAGGGGGSVTATRLARRKLLAFAAAAVAALVVLGAAGAVALSRSSDKVQLSSTSSAAFTAQVTATPPVAASKCTTATTFAFAGTVTAVQPGTLSYQWLYSTGKLGPVQTLSFAAAGDQAVNGGTVSARKSSSGWAEIKMLAPAGKTSNRATYKLLCGSTANSDVALSAAVSPAAQTVSSCGAAAPSLTASGSVTSKKAGKVSYYWALGNGTDSAASTVTFAAPGTKAIAPMTITPPALPASGEAVLVVTSPVSAASSPAPYRVSCTVPVTVAPTTSAHATPPPSVKTSASTSASPGKSTAPPTKPASTPPTTPPTTPTTTPPTTPTSTPPTTTPPTTPTSTPPTTPTSTPPTTPTTPASTPPTTPATTSSSATAAAPPTS